MKRLVIAVLVVVLSATGLSACSSSSLVPGSALSVGLLNELGSFNSDVPAGVNAVQANEDLANLIRPQLFTLDTAGELVANEAFGSVKLLSTNPFKVEYRIAGSAKWSNGEPVSASDLLLSWVAARNPLDAGFQSRAAASGLRFASTVPEVSGDGLALTVTFEHPVSDWQTALEVNASALAVASDAFGAAGDVKANLERLLVAIKTGVLADQQALAKAYAATFEFTNANKYNAALKLTAGAYSVVEFHINRDIVLKANPDYNWGPSATVEQLTLNLYPDSTAMLAAMQQGEVDICAPRESGIATLGSLASLAKTNGSQYLVQASHDIEAILLNFASGSVFADSSSSPANAKVIREAFLALVPRMKIQNAVSSEGIVIDARSWIYAKDSNYYEPFIQSNGSEKYLIQNAEVAAEKLKALGVRTPIDVRVLYGQTNPRSVAEFKLLGEYASSAGFNIVDASAPSVTLTPMPDGVDAQQPVFDVKITTVALAGEAGGSPYWFTAGSATAFVDSALDGMLSEYSTKSKAIDQINVLKRVDAELYSAQFGLPLYQVPTLLVYSKKISALVPAPNGGSATYGFWSWQLASN